MRLYVGLLTMSETLSCRVMLVGSRHGERGPLLCWLCAAASTYSGIDDVDGGIAGFSNPQLRLLFAASRYFSHLWALWPHAC
jgi:hypothetical protein